jgi:hypothetical protein
VNQPRKTTPWRFAAIVALVLGVSSCSGSSAISAGRLHTFRECADGWQSPSIGVQGACSHHGGVVTRHIDNRTDAQRYACYGLNGLGVICLGASLILGFGQPPPAGPKVTRLRIEGESAVVPLVIAGESRLVTVQRVTERTYETQHPVALVRCPAGKRSSVYVSKIKFNKVGDLFRQDLSTWIYTGRGRSLGYLARAFRWNEATSTAHKSEV